MLQSRRFKVTQLASGVRRALMPVALAVPLAATAPVAHATINPVGDEFIVNAFVTDDQDLFRSGQTVVVAPDGDFVVVWDDDYGVDGDNDGVFFRIFNANGSPQTGDTQVNVTTAGNQRDPSIAVDGMGNFVIVWESPDGSSDGIFARTYNAAGAPTSGEIAVNSTTSGDQDDPSVAMDTSGDFVVAWDSPDSDSDGIFARTFSAAGAPTSAEIPVNTTTADTQRDAVVAINADGDFAVAWESRVYSAGSTSEEVFLRTFDATGAATSGEVMVNTTTAGDQDEPSIAMSALGAIAVAWQSGGFSSGPGSQDGDDRGVFYRRFSSAGEPISGEMQANQTTAQPQARPSVSMQSDGDFVIAWNSYLQDGDDYGIWARDFAANGTPTGPEVQISQQAEGDQEDPSIYLADDGTIVVAFRSGDDTSGDIGPPRAGGDDDDIIARRMVLNPVPPVPADNPVALFGLAAGAGLLGAAALRRRRKAKR